MSGSYCVAVFVQGSTILWFWCLRNKPCNIYPRKLIRCNVPRTFMRTGGWTHIITLFTSFFVLSIKHLSFPLSISKFKIHGISSPVLVDQLSSILHQSLYSELLLHITETKNRWRFSLECDLLHSTWFQDWNCKISWGWPVTLWHSSCSQNLASQIPPFVLVVASYHGLDFKVHHLYTTCIRGAV